MKEIREAIELSREEGIDVKGTVLAWTMLFGGVAAMWIMLFTLGCR